MHNLLTESLIRTTPGGPATLPELLARLARDEVDGFPALRPHQAPAWHMFLVQVAALAMHHAGTADLPLIAEVWSAALRGLTAAFPDDAPWCLCVADAREPAFLQPPVPEGVTLATEVPSADALDLLITAKNHDLKQSVAHDSAAEDWVLALVSLQTGEGYGGQGNYGISRMNGGSSSRTMLGLAPISPGPVRAQTPRPGAWFRRDVMVLLETREAALEEASHLGFAPSRGLGLTWLAPWPEGQQLALSALDIWYVEACRRVRLFERDGRIIAGKGTSKAERIAAKQLKGVLGDPWAPVHVNDAKSLTLAGNDFDYRMLAELMTGDWSLPLLARPAAGETPGEGMLMVAAALSRGNSKTEGFKSRILPLPSYALGALVDGVRRSTLGNLAKAQIDDIAAFDKALRDGLVLVPSGGGANLPKDHYAFTREARDRFDRAADAVFFPHLWRRLAAQDEGHEMAARVRRAFLDALHAEAKRVFDTALPAMPCPSLFRPRAEARARQRFRSSLRRFFPSLFEAAATQEALDDVDA
ncbi:MAG: CRISPR-associated protein Cse1 [Rhodospirillales bacterium 69-11]|nr:CRISPR-associated protein Cse1 [Rhodospirillales bacterium]ODU62385.1 MAG: CRISPR-associated protein Cse1 [Acetobacteraceae bacterium SCN 69-10]OJW19296.1 MAG: CRISPR-associated protein Cse1 [Rhodospirillales bacterium 69-11]